MGILDTFKLDGRVAYVTGGGRGIGKTCALALAEAGADVALIDIQEDLIKNAAEDIKRKTGQNAFYVHADVTDSAQVKEAFTKILERYGRLDIGLNNAGICINTPAEKTSDEDWLKIMNVNVNGVYFCCREAGRIMLAQHGGGSIINTASMSAQIVNRPQPQAAYNASKAAVVQMSKSLACEWAPSHIRVNSISPGYTGTEMTMRENMKPLHEKWIQDTPMKRLAFPMEVAGAVVFLASDAASFITAHDLVVDGGFTAW